MIENISPPDDPALADQILETLDDVCKEFNLPFFLFGGTCLGFYRDETYVVDNDLDTCLVSTEQEYQAVWNRLAHLDGWTDACGLRKGPIQLDLHYTDKNREYYIIPHWNPYPYAFYQFETVLHHGRSYRIPSPAEEYLRWEFGENWRQPLTRKEWLEEVRLLRKRLLGDD
jgi:hypothetical protein